MVATLIANYAFRNDDSFLARLQYQPQTKLVYLQIRQARDISSARAVSSYAFSNRHCTDGINRQDSDTSRMGMINCESVVDPIAGRAAVQEQILMDLLQLALPSTT